MQLLRIVVCMHFVILFTLYCSANLFAQPSNLAACDPNQYLYSLHMDADEDDGALGVTRTSHNCGTAVVGRAFFQGAYRGYILALDQKGDKIFSNVYLPNSGRYVRVVESIENGTPYLIAVGHEPFGRGVGPYDAILVTKVNALTGAFIWERRIDAKGHSNLDYLNYQISEIVADETGYYVLFRGQLNITPTEDARELMLVKLDFSGANHPSWANHIYEPFGKTTRNIDGIGMRLYDGTIYVTGYISYPEQNNNAFFNRPYVLEFDPTTGAVNNGGQGTVLIHTDVENHYQSVGNDIWVGSLQGSPTTVVVIGDLELASFEHPPQGAFVNRLTGSNPWEGRKLLSRGEEPELIWAEFLDFGVDQDPSWIIAGRSFRINGMGAYLLEFDLNWWLRSGMYGKANPDPALLTDFNDVVSWGNNGSVSPVTIEEGYTAVGFRTREVNGMPLQADSYIVKAGEDLYQADDCRNYGESQFDELDTELDDFTIAPIYPVNNVSQESFPTTWADPEPLCKETIPFGKSGVERYDLDLKRQELSSSLSVSAHVDAHNGIVYFLNSGIVQDVNISIVDLRGQALESRSISLNAGDNDVYMSVNFPAAGMYFARIETANDVFHIQHVIHR